MANISAAIDDQKKLLKHIERMTLNFHSKEKNEQSKGFVQAMLDDLEVTFKLFKDGHDKLINIIHELSMAESDVPYLTDDIYYTFYDKYISFKSTLFDLIFEFETPQSSSVHASTFAAPSVRQESMAVSARLPKIDLPIFSGDYLDWIAYRDMFLSLVHNNSSLTNVQKYYYLRGSCTGTPLFIINEYPVSESSYDLAWDALEKRFHNERKIIEQILKRLFSIPPSNGNFESVKVLLDTTRNCIAQLKALKIDTSTWDSILVYMTTQKLDVSIRKEWEKSLGGSTTLPAMSSMLVFLETTFRTLESVEETASQSHLNKNRISNFAKDSKKIQPKSIRAHTVSMKQDDNCPRCSKRHPLYKCFRFLSLASSEKRNLVNQKRLCRNCLNTGHLQSTCKVNARCQICNESHHTTIHQEFSSFVDNKGTSQNTSQQNSAINANFANQATNPTFSTPNVSANLSSHNSKQLIPALLPTVKVAIKTQHRTLHIKALLDQGSQVSFISEDLAQLLHVPKYKTHVEISGVGAVSTFTAKRYIYVTIHSLCDSKFELPLYVLVVPSVTSYFPSKGLLKTVPDLTHYALADPEFLLPEKIDLLLGNDVYGDIILGGLIKYKDGLLLQETHFGWTVSGPPGSSTTIRTISVNNCSIANQLRLFWEQEELVDYQPHVNEDKLCEKLFAETHFRDESGRYTVSLPFKKLIRGKELPTFSHTDYNALKRLKQLESSFRSKPIFAQEYKKFMSEYEYLQHMTKVGEYPEAIPKNAYFFPHHGVLRENSSTTKLRVVFDGSSCRPPQPSINDELAAGPSLQNDLASIIIRWRRYKIGFTADLEKMFRQINVNKEHQNFQCILWRDEKSNKIFVYKLQTVTYGTTSAPYLAIRVLQQLSMDERENFPEASATLYSDTYVDDVISGAESLSEAVVLQEQLRSLLKSGGFHLRKWNSNSAELLKNVPEEDREKKDLFHIHQYNMSKALGICWDTNNDCFHFNINFIFTNPVTKSSLLSDAGKLFDPLGWLAPSTVLAKIQFQKLWKINLNWNDELPKELQDEWIQFRNGLKDLEEIQLPRWIGHKPTRSIELHAFCDASQTAYAAVVYSRIITETNEIVVSLLQAKTKVAPLKRETIPRLELCAAALLARLVSKIEKTIKLQIQCTTYWTDSTIVLAWLKSESCKLDVYIKNRVQIIRNLSDVDNWNYVPSAENPADCASRGLPPRKLVNHHLWWQGPQWLKSPPSTWPNKPTTIENKIHVTTLTSTDCTQDTCKKSKEFTESIFANILTKFSSLSNLVRVTSYVLRYIFNLRQKIQCKEREYGFLKTYELNRAMNKLILFTQRTTFQEEIICLKSGKSLSTKSKIRQLNPFLDDMKILRVGGRLFNSSLPYRSKHPILLSKQNYLSLLIFLDAHNKTLHGGVQLMQSYVMQRYWIPSGRDVAKSVLRKCIVCFKYRAKTCQQLMGNLPLVRTQPSRPFKHTGLDYAGPITIKASALRTASSTKSYICLFICMCTKAIHLEAATDLSVEAFLAAFRRFTSRRGMCTDLYSDCGTNFIGANKQLQILYQRNKASLPEHLVENLANQGTTWHFIPPASPHFGGLWEAGVKSTKHHLRRIMKDRSLTFEELCTLLAQIESCLNSRPLCPISTDPVDNYALTPAHFLIGESTTCIPDENLLDQNINRLNRWKLIERMKQHFWERWKKEYICRLQARPKWNKVEDNIKKGDVVILLHEKSGPGQWPLAIVNDLHPGSDGLVRVVTLYCNGKLIKRPISKICLLPITDAQSSTEEI